MKYLVTGASGFIGTNLVKYLNEKGHEVIGHYYTGGNLENFNEMSRHVSKVV